MKALSTYQNFYFVGIGGIGMSALARYFNASGKKVMGYDKTPTKITAALMSEGIDITFDDVLNARRFSSVIYKTDNGMGRGGSGIIDEYIPNDAERQLEESDRIKAQILQMENDMWNY